MLINIHPDGNINNFEYVIKIDHHPIIDKYANIEVIDDNACSTCQLILEFAFANKINLSKSVGEKLYLGIVGGVLNNGNIFLWSSETDVLHQIKGLPQFAKKTHLDKTDVTNVKNKSFCNKGNFLKMLPRGQCDQQFF